MKCYQLRFATRKSNGKWWTRGKIVFEDLQGLLDEIKTIMDEESTGAAKLDVQSVEMEPSDLEKIPEFEGY